MHHGTLICSPGSRTFGIYHPLPRTGASLPRLQRRGWVPPNGYHSNFYTMILILLVFIQSRYRSSFSAFLGHQRPFNHCPICRTGHKSPIIVRRFYQNYIFQPQAFVLLKKVSYLSIYLQTISLFDPRILKVFLP